MATVGTKRQDLPWMTTASSEIPSGSGQDYAPHKRPAFADSSKPAAPEASVRYGKDLSEYSE